MNRDNFIEQCRYWKERSRTVLDIEMYGSLLSQPHSYLLYRLVSAYYILGFISQYKIFLVLSDINKKMYWINARTKRIFSHY